MISELGATYIKFGRREGKSFAFQSGFQTLDPLLRFEITAL